jgi:hypothetical protein
LAATYLSDASIVLTSLGDIKAAIAIGERLLEAARTAGNQHLAAIQLNNLGFRRGRLAFFAREFGDLDAAQALLAGARLALEESISLRAQDEAPSAEASRLIPQANLVRIEIEEALVGSPSGPEALDRAYAHGANVLRRAHENPAVGPGPRVSRAAALGMVECERARCLRRATTRIPHVPVRARGAR